MPESRLLEVRNLSVEFRTRSTTAKAVRNVSWSLDRGETLAILGESGSGKSVSATAVMGLIDSPPGHITSGEILYRGEDLLKKSEAERRDINGRRIAMIFQDPLAHLNPLYSVGWQIAEALRSHGVNSGEAHTRAVDLLKRVGISNAADRAGDYPHQFSGGQRQRVMIAMAVALKPDLLIADEPTTALDVTVQAQILVLLRELQAETGMGLLLITHDLGVVAETADRLVVMKDGEIVEMGTVQNVFREPQHPYTRQLLAAMPGRRPFRTASDKAEPIFEVRGLSKDYQVPRGLFGMGSKGSFRALDQVSFTLRKGETLGIVGESGSGKTTLARTLLLLTKPSGGRAHYRGKDIFRMTARELFEFRRRFQAVFQDPTASLNPRMSVGEIVAEPWAIHPGVFPGASGEGPSRVSWAKSVSGGTHRPLSAPVLRRPASAHCDCPGAALKPEVILCDEAVSALDVSVQAQVIELLKTLQAEHGLSYIFIAHDLPVVRDFADRVLVMSKGRIVEQGPTATVFTAPKDPYTQTLLAASPEPDPDRHMIKCAVG